MMRRLSLLLLLLLPLLLLTPLSASAQPGTTRLLNAVGQILSTSAQGQQSVTLYIPASATAELTLVPIACFAPNCLATDWLEGYATFSNGSTAITLTPPSDAVVVTIILKVPAPHVGVKVTNYIVGDITPTIRSQAMLPTVSTFTSKNGVPTELQCEDLGGGYTCALIVSIPHAVGVFGVNIPATATIALANDAVTINGTGAGQIIFEVSSGCTGTMDPEARIGGLTWFSTGVTYASGSATSFPARGHFNISGYTEYRIRFSVLSAGTCTAHLEVSPGAPMSPIVSIAANSAINLAQVAGATVQTGSGTATGAQRVEIANNGTGTVGLNAGSNLVGQIAPTAQATTTNSALSHQHISTASTNDITIKASAGNVYAIHITNTTTTIAYVRMYNSTDQTCSSATGYVESIPAVPASAAGGAGVNGRVVQVGEAYTTGIGYCITGGGSSTDNTNAPAGIYVQTKYK